MKALQKISYEDFESNLYDFLQSKKWTLKKAKELSGGGITKQNKKMPFYNYDLSAWDCKKGSQLRNVKNSVCGKCYAMKGNYLLLALRLLPCLPWIIC